MVFFVFPLVKFLINVISYSKPGNLLLMTMLPQWAIIGGSVLLPNLGGFLGGYITRSQIKTWYDKGKKLAWPV